jgi:hypothetical protein
MPNPDTIIFVVGEAEPRLGPRDSIPIVGIVIVLRLFRYDGVVAFVAFVVVVVVAAVVVVVVVVVAVDVLIAGIKVIAIASLLLC